MTTRIVVADQGEARLYDAAHFDSELTLVGELVDPAARLHDRDLKSDRPGRVFDHAPGPGRRGATGHHGTGEENTPRKHAAVVFAHQITQRLVKDHDAGQFSRLVLIAGPRFLGNVRESLPDSLRSILTLEIAKDLVHEPESELRKRIAPFGH